MLYKKKYTAASLLAAGKLFERHCEEKMKSVANTVHISLQGSL